LHALTETPVRWISDRGETGKRWSWSQAFASAQSSENGANTNSVELSSSQSSHARSTPPTSEDGSSGNPNENSEAPTDQSPMGKDPQPPGGSLALNITPPSSLTGYILFGVLGSTRLRSARLHLAQIDVQKVKDDDGFFDEMTAQYKILRGPLLRLFSIWQFHTCDFILVSYFTSKPTPIWSKKNQMD